MLKRREQADHQAKVAPVGHGLCVMSEPGLDLGGGNMGSACIVIRFINITQRSEKGLMYFQSITK